MGLFDQLVDRIVSIESRFRGLPQFRWGVVTSSDPLSVTLDAEADPLLGAPSTLVSGLAVGDRVLVLIHNRRYTVIGSGKSGGRRVLFESPGIYMQASQTAALSQKLSEQKTGIVLAWSAYSGGAAANHNWNYTFVPKEHVAFYPGAGVRLLVRSGATGASKYVYVYDDRITGHDENATAPNNVVVLRYVIGV